MVSPSIRSPRVVSAWDSCTGTPKKGGDSRRHVSRRDRRDRLVTPGWFHASHVVAGPKWVGTHGGTADGNGRRQLGNHPVPGARVAIVST